MHTRRNDSTAGLNGKDAQKETTSTIAEAENWSLPETNHEPYPVSIKWYMPMRSFYEEKPNSTFCFKGMNPTLANLRRYLPWYATGEWLKDSLRNLPLLTESIADVRAREAAYLRPCNFASPFE